MTKPTTLKRKGLQKLDLLLLVIESLDINGSQAMLWIANNLGLDKQIPNSVELWKLRCRNPLRRSTRRDKLNHAEFEALLVLLGAMAERTYPLIHQLLSSHEPPNVNSERWGLFESRLVELINERLNSNRNAVKTLIEPSNIKLIHKQLVITLALCSGPNGIARLRSSLIDSIQFK